MKILESIFQVLMVMVTRSNEGQPLIMADQAGYQTIKNITLAVSEYLQNIGNEYKRERVCANTYLISCTAFYPYSDLSRI